MKSLFKYMGIAAILFGGFYYTEKMSNIVINNSSLVNEINKSSGDYNVEAVSAVITKDYIIPGLNGYAVNVLKSYNNMRYLDTFNSYYLEYDKIVPEVSIENNKDKIIKYGNESKRSVSLIIKDNIDVLNYSVKQNLSITRLIDNKTFDSSNRYEQINNDYLEYNKVETMLNNNNINQNICYVDNNIKDICLKNKKYLVEASLILNNYNLASVKDKIRSGYIIYINDNVNLTNFKLLLNEINYHDLKIINLSELISEENKIVNNK